MKKINTLAVIALVLVLGLAACDSQTAPSVSLTSTVPTATSQSTPVRAPTAMPSSTATPILFPTPTPTSLPTSVHTYRWECWSEGHSVSCPYDSSLSLQQMAFVSDTEAWAVGNDGYIARWDGFTWTQIESPIDQSMNDVTFLSPDDGWAVGEGGLILRWDGSVWSVVRDFQPPLAGSGDFLIWNAVGFSAPDDGWVVGYTSTEGGLGLDAMHWNGTMWEGLPTPPLFCHNCVLSDVVALSRQDAWMVGESSGGLTLHWDGVSWHAVPNPFSPLHLGRCWLHSISALSPDDVWVAGMRLMGAGWSDTGLVLHWNGAEWLNAQLPETGWISSILMLSEEDGWVGGNELFRWNGHEWERAAKPTVDWDRVVDIQSSPNGEVWALTEHGAFLHLEASE